VRIAVETGLSQRIEEISQGFLRCSPVKRAAVIAISNQGFLWRCTHRGAPHVFGAHPLRVGANAAENEAGVFILNLSKPYLPAIAFGVLAYCLRLRFLLSVVEIAYVQRFEAL
jgi:hypothetical protein